MWYQINKGAYWAWAIKNSVSVICWTILAIKFNTWWIALFAVFFISSLQTNVLKYRICDGCGKHSPYSNSHNEALDKAKEAGWIHLMAGDRDYCPECKDSIKERF